MTYAKKVGYLPVTILIAGGASDLGANVYVTCSGSGDGAYGLWGDQGRD